MNEPLFLELIAILAIHPLRKLSTILRQQGFRPEVIRAASELKCSVCDAHAEPKHARPSVLRDDLDFNDRISI